MLRELECVNLAGAAGCAGSNCFCSVFLVVHVFRDILRTNFMELAKTNVYRLYGTVPNLTSTGTETTNLVELG